MGWRRFPTRATTAGAIYRLPLYRKEEWERCLAGHTNGDERRRLVGSIRGVDRNQILPGGEFDERHIDIRRAFSRRGCCQRDHLIAIAVEQPRRDGGIASAALRNHSNKQVFGTPELAIGKRHGVEI